MTPNRLNRYISQMEAFRRKHGYPRYGPASRFTNSNVEYAWADDDLLQYGGSEQEDMGDG